MIALAPLDRPAGAQYIANMGRVHDADFEAYLQSDEGANASLIELRAIRSCAQHHEIPISPAMYRALRGVFAQGNDNNDASLASRDAVRGR